MGFRFLSHKVNFPPFLLTIELSYPYIYLTSTWLTIVKSSMFENFITFNEIGSKQVSSRCRDLDFWIESSAFTVEYHANFYLTMSKKQTSIQPIQPSKIHQTNYYFRWAIRVVSEKFIKVCNFTNLLINLIRYA